MQRAGRLDAHPRCKHSVCSLFSPPSSQEKRDKKTSDGQGYRRSGKGQFGGPSHYVKSVEKGSSYLIEAKHAAEKLRISTSIAV